MQNALQTSIAVSIHRRVFTSLQIQQSVWFFKTLVTLVKHTPRIWTPHGLRIIKYFKLLGFFFRHHSIIKSLGIYLRYQQNLNRLQNYEKKTFTCISGKLLCYQKFVYYCDSSASIAQCNFKYASGNIISKSLKKFKIFNILTIGFVSVKEELLYLFISYLI